MELGRWLVPRVQALCSEGEIIPHTNFDSSIGHQFIRMSIGIDGNSADAHRRDQFSHARWKASGVLSESGYAVLQMLYVLVDTQVPQVLHGVLLNLAVLGSLERCRPQH